MRTSRDEDGSLFKTPDFKPRRGRSNYHLSRRERLRYNRAHYGGKSSISGDSLLGARRRAPNVLVLALVASGLAVLATLVLLPVVVGRNRIIVRGFPDQAPINAKILSGLSVVVSVRPVGALKGLTLLVDGKPGNVAPNATSVRWLPGLLTDGVHTVTIRSGSRLLWRTAATKTLRLRIDSTRPAVTLDAPQGKVTPDRPVLVTGTVEEGSRVTVDGEVATVAKRRFSVRLPVPPIGLLRVEATDQAGNKTLVEKRSFVELPGIQGVHMSAKSWVTPQLRDPVLRMAAEKRINTVVLDLKDESGLVVYRSSVPKVFEIGADGGEYDLKSAVDTIHALGLRASGRLVAFRDPVFASAAVKTGRLDEVVQNARGEPYKSSYGEFTNPASEEVQKYLYDIAREAANIGIDDIFLDYVRRPEGTLTKMSFPGLTETSPETVSAMIVDFVTGVAGALHGTTTRLGVSVFGISARSPDDIGQNIPALALRVDYVAPMVYPSHWRGGYYNVSDPGNSPYEIVSRSLADFQSQLGETDAVVIPWLQDFTLEPGRKYGAPEVLAQIKAAREQRSAGFMLWDPRVTYTADGIPRDALTLSMARAVVTTQTNEAAATPRQSITSSTKPK